MEVSQPEYLDVLPNRAALPFKVCCHFINITPVLFLPQVSEEEVKWWRERVHGSERTVRAVTGFSSEICAEMFAIQPPFSIIHHPLMKGSWAQIWPCPTMASRTLFLYSSCSQDVGLACPAFQSTPIVEAESPLHCPLAITPAPSCATTPNPPQRFGTR